MLGGVIELQTPGARRERCAAVAADDMVEDEAVDTVNRGDRDETALSNFNHQPLGDRQVADEETPSRPSGCTLVGRVICSPDHHHLSGLRGRLVGTSSRVKLALGARL
jgi:hypothetical protein